MASNLRSRLFIFIAFALVSNLEATVNIPRFCLGEITNNNYRRNTGYGKAIYPHTFDELEQLGTKIPNGVTFALPANLNVGKVVDVQLDEQTYPLMLIEQTSNGRFMEFTDLVGRHFYAEGQSSRQAWPGALTYMFVSRATTPFSPIVTTYQTPERDFRLPADLHEYAKTLASLRIQNSSTWREADRSERQVLLDRYTEAYDDMLLLFQSGRPLSKEHIKKWNKSIHVTNETDIRLRIMRYADGLLRESEQIVTGEDGSIIVDLKDTEVPMEYSDNRYIFATRSRLVPARLNQLLGDINSMDGATPFAQPAAIPHRFLRLHAPLEGTGRTALLLMDFALMKAGFTPPMRPFHRGVKLATWTSREESIASIASLYDKP